MDVCIKPASETDDMIICDGEVGTVILYSRTVVATAFVKVGKVGI